MNEEWDGRERRRRRECWDGKPEQRKNDHKYSMIDAKIPVFAAIAAIVSVAVAWGAMNTSVSKQEERIEKVEQIVPIVAQQQVIIPEIQKTTEQVRTAQITFNEKYDRNREADQRFFQELLREVKKQ